MPTDRPSLIEIALARAAARGGTVTPPPPELVDEVYALRGSAAEGEILTYVDGRPEWRPPAGGGDVGAWPSVLSAFEFAPLSVFGHSWANGGPDIATGARLADRLAARFKSVPFVNRGAAGARMDEILASQVKASWTPNGLGWALFVDGTINDSVQYGDTSGTPTTKEAFRTCLSLLSAKAVLGNTDQGVAFSAGASAASIPTGEYVDVAFTGDAVDLQFTFAAGAGGTFTVKDTAGTTVATVATGGYKQSFTGTRRISGFGAGDHTVRITATAGSGKFVGMALPSANPVPIVWVQSAARNTGTASVALAAQYAAAAATIAALFPNVIGVAADASWDQARYVGPGFHPNDLGMAYLTTLCERAMAGVVHRQGLNQISLSTQDPAYTSPLPSYTGGASTSAPDAPVLTATTGAQIDLSWTTPASHGSAITGYALQQSPAGANAWATVATPAAGTNAYAITSGLAQGSVYDFRITATNGVGTSPQSSTATATAGATAGGSTFDSDTFTDTSGVSVAAHAADQGGPWVKHSSYNTSAAVISTANRLRNNGGGGVSSLFYMTGAPPSADYDVDADFVVQSLPAGAQTAICGRVQAAANTFYMARYRPDVPGWELVKKVNGTTTVLATSAPATLTIGQSYHVKLRMRGTTLTMFVDGTQVATATDAAISAPGQAGVFLVETAAPSAASAIHLDSFAAA